MRAEKHVYLFQEGNSTMKSLLGGKGANLAEMTRIDLPVPPGFTITTKACNDYYRQGGIISPLLKKEIREALQNLEKMVKKKFGDINNPLLLSVRSGAVASMPGMMDTILNLGLNDRTVEAFGKATDNPRFALDCYRRFIQMFGDVVLKIEYHYFENILEEIKKELGLKSDTELGPEALKKVIEDYKRLIERKTGGTFPQDPSEQLFMSIQAVFDSWNNQRAIVYRQLNKIPDDLGTAVNVQVMVFGNYGEDSGTGVVFTRNPSTGEKKLYGEFLMNAQGEDVVAGIRTPRPIDELNEVMPSVYQQFVESCRILENHYKDMQDIEFTVERGKLYLLQTRTGKRTATAAVKIAVEMTNEDIISRKEAINRVEPEYMEQLLHKRIDTDAILNVIAEGLPASPGAASGKVVFDANKAEKCGRAGEKVILVRPETTPDDIHGIVASQGVLTSRGGMTSHAAVVARGMGKPCICGCENLKIDLESSQFFIEDKKLVIQEGDEISLDGSTGKVMLGEVPLIMPELSDEFKELLSWADEIRTIRIRANADTPTDAAKARQFGAEGIGLCRTEHMFMAQERLPVVQEMILAESQQEREKALKKLLLMQQKDFEDIFRVMEGLPTTIRLLDPPLHEFLSNSETLIVEITRMEERGDDINNILEKKTLLKKVKTLAEFNPMLGHRGCRLGIVYPEIYDMQARAIFQAVATLVKEGIEVFPEVMIPLVGHVNELKYMRNLVEQVAKGIQQEQKIEFSYLIGTMIELPRACMTADEIADEADFFSFGTNDLTQTTFGFSRDDAESKFLPYYIQKKILSDNPFMVLDQDGVGALIREACNRGRSKNSDLELGICGEHGGEPSSIEFCYRIGLNYVSCSPFRVPIARLSAAQSKLKND